MCETCLTCGYIHSLGSRCPQCAGKLELDSLIFFLPEGDWILIKDTLAIRLDDFDKLEISIPYTSDWRYNIIAEAWRAFCNKPSRYKEHRIYGIKRQ